MVNFLSGILLGTFYLTGEPQTVATSIFKVSPSKVHVDVINAWMAVAGLAYYTKHKQKYVN